VNITDVRQWCVRVLAVRRTRPRGCVEPVAGGSLTFEELRRPL
jgi:hypothetical protein